MKRHQNHTSSNFFSTLDLSNPTISLSKAMISTPLLKQLCEAISRVETVTHLDLSHNQIGDAGAEIVAELLYDKPLIKTLNLKSNGIGDLGVSMLCRALGRHATLKHLNLSSNPISDLGLSELGKFLSSSSSSTASNQQQQQQMIMNNNSSSINNNNNNAMMMKYSLGGGGNMINNDIHVLLEELDLMDTPISLQGTLLFADALVKNESLLTVKLPHVLGHRVLQEVHRLMQRNWIRKNRLDEKLAILNVERNEEENQQSRLQHQWSVYQPKAKPPPPASGFTIEEWSDPQLVPSLMYLEILNRKTKMFEKEKSREERKRNRNLNNGSASSNNNKLPAVQNSGRRLF